MPGVAVIPMFPLGMTVLPGVLLPLHVFEERYVQMVHDLLADDTAPPEFGVVMIERGSEVGGGEARSDIGTLCRVLDMSALAGGRYQLVASGRARIRVVAWLPDDPYPLADVDTWPDEREPPADGSAQIARLHGRVREINALVRELGQGEPPADDEISSDPSLALYHLAALSPIGASDRLRVLAAPSVEERIEVLDEVLDDARAVLDFGRS